MPPIFPDVKVISTILFLLLLTGCQGNPAATTPLAASSPAAAATVVQNSGDGEGLKVPGLSPQAKVSYQPDASLQVDQWGARQQGDRVEVLLDGKLYATAVQKRSDWLVQRVDGEPLAKLKIRESGDFKVVSPSDTTMVKVKAKDYGWKVTGDQEQELYKVRVEKGHIKVKDAQGQEVDKLPDDGHALTYTWLSLDSLALELRIALAYITKGTKHG